MDKRQSRIQIIVTTLLLLGIAVASVILWDLSQDLQPGFEALHVPRVETQLDGSDGISHVVRADVSIAVGEGGEPNMSDEQLQAMVTLALQDMGYDELSAKGGMDGLKEKIKSQLPDEFGVEVDVYFGNLAADMQLDTEAAGGGNSNRGDVFKALFPNSK